MTDNTTSRSRRPFGLLCRTAAALALAAALPFSSAAQAGEGEVVLKLLLKKGIITQTEYNQVMDELEGGESLESQVKENRARLDEVARAQQERIIHVDKHLAHMEKGMARTIDGLTVAGGATMIIQGSSGNDSNLAINPEGDVTDGSYSADLELSVPLADKGEAFLHIEAGEGNGLEGEEISSFWGVNGDAAETGANLQISEAYYEHRFLDDRLTATIGKLDLSYYFDTNEVANNERTQFLAGGFINNIALDMQESSAGVRLTAAVNDLIDLSLAWQSGDTNWEDIFDNAFYIAEVDLKPQFSGRAGNYRLYTWTNQVDHATIKGDKNDAPGWGIGASLDQQVTEALTLFARYGYQNGDVYSFDTAISAGFSLAGSLWGRENDELALAWGMALLSDDYEADRRSHSITPGDETHFEAYYRIFVTDYLAITPDLQVMNNADGNDNFDTVWLGAVRGQLNF